MTLPDGHTRFGIGGEGTTLGPREFSLPPAAVDALFSQIKTVLANPAPVAPLVRARIKAFAGDIADTETGEWVLHVCMMGAAPLGPLDDDDVAALHAEFLYTPAMLAQPRITTIEQKPIQAVVKRSKTKIALWITVLAAGLTAAGYALYHLL